MARLVKSLPQGRLAVCGPTGKSAVRVTETLQRAGVEGVRATTVHSLLKPSRDEDSGQWSFEHDEENPLDLDWILLDEGSMECCQMLGHLLAARRPGCKLVICGDVNQLPPVGFGAPLRDLITAGVPTGELVEIRRNAGRIVRCCHGIIDKHRFEPSPAMDLAAESPENLLHVERREPDGQIQAIKSMLEAFRGGKELQVRKDGEIVSRRIDPVWDVQVLVPVNEKSPLGRIALNRILEGFLNPGGETVAGSPFRVGSKIVNGKNGWMPVETRIPKGIDGGPWNENQKDGKVFSANGELGKVLAVLPTYTVARLWLPDRIIRIPKGQSYEGEDGETQDTGCSWDLAYAISAHKSQGSQWPVTITVADAYPGARMLCDRSWLYTALSRAEILGITVGQREVISEMCGKSHLWSRKTFLCTMIEELKQQSLTRGFEEALA
jgi:exodeoxyribonuclease V alpha subunit